MAMALRFAGSANQPAFQTMVLDYILIPLTLVSKLDEGRVYTTCSVYSLSSVIFFLLISRHTPMRMPNENIKSNSCVLGKKRVESELLYVFSF